MGKNVEMCIIFFEGIWFGVFEERLSSELSRWMLTVVELE